MKSSSILAFVCPALSVSLLYSIGCVKRCCKGAVHGPVGDLTLPRHRPTAAEEVSLFRDTKSRRAKNSVLDFNDFHRVRKRMSHCRSRLDWSEFQWNLRVFHWKFGMLQMHMFHLAAAGARVKEATVD